MRDCSCWIYYLRYATSSRKVCVPGMPVRVTSTIASATTSRYLYTAALGLAMLPLIF
jgi:hypothetical protein